jgi:hypothetical protein
MEKGTVTQNYKGNKHKNISHADETGYSSGFHHTRHYMKGEPCNGGKNSKERIMVLLACNANGTHKLPLLLLGRGKALIARKMSESCPQKSMGYTGHLYYFKGIRCQNKFPEKKYFTFC